MQIDIAKVSEGGSRYVGEENAAFLELGNERHLRITGPVRYDLFVERLQTELLVKGELVLELEVACGRCTEFYSTTVRVSSFLRAYEIKESDESVDITADLREDLLLELPVYPVCSTVCKGLCPQCGVNLNQGSCTCRPPEGDSRWGALDQLK